MKELIKNKTSHKAKCNGNIHEYVWKTANRKSKTLSEPKKKIYIYTVKLKQTKRTCEVKQSIYTKQAIK